MVWTICFLVKGNKVCLALKKRGHGVGRWNGTGGKPLDGETLDDTAKRETLEEIGATILQMKKVAEIEFKDLPTGTSHHVTAFVCTEWEGTPVETEEMRPQWFEFNEVPYEQMWSADKIWIPQVLAGKRIKAVFEYSEGDTLVGQTIETL